MDSEEYSYWIALSQLEPIGERRSDLRTGSIISALYACNWSSKSKKPPSIEDCTFNFDPPKKQPISQMKKILQGMINRGKKCQ